jgi:hypothetical protein
LNGLADGIVADFTQYRHGPEPLTVVKRPSKVARNACPGSRKISARHLRDPQNVGLWAFPVPSAGAFLAGSRATSREIRYDAIDDEPRWPVRRSIWIVLVWLATLVHAGAYAILPPTEIDHPAEVSLMAPPLKAS